MIPCPHCRKPVRERFSLDEALVVCLLHSELGRPVPALVSTKDGVSVVRCRICVDLGRAILSGKHKAAAAP